MVPRSKNIGPIHCCELDGFRPAYVMECVGCRECRFGLGEVNTYCWNGNLVYVV